MTHDRRNRPATASSRAVRGQSRSSRRAGSSSTRSSSSPPLLPVPALRHDHDIAQDDAGDPLGQHLHCPPIEWTFEPWIKAWTTACTGLNCNGLAPGFWNSVKITVPSTIVSIMIAAVNGYALVNWKLQGLGALLHHPDLRLVHPLPGDALSARDDRQAVQDLSARCQAIILVHTIFGMPILTLLFRNYFASLPTELFKAARVDGAGFWRIFFEIMLPMSLPIFVVAHHPADHRHLERLPVRRGLRRHARTCR